MALEQAPGELHGLADVLTVLLPWGSLLRAVARPEPAALLPLRALCKPAAQVRIVFGYDPASDRAAIQALDLPALDDPTLPARLQAHYREVGLEMSVRAFAAGELAALPTTWAQKLAQGSRPRSFFDLVGKVASVDDFSR